MKMRTVRDVIGDPVNWQNSISDGSDAMPDVSGATILDVFANARQIAVHLRAKTGAETLSVFQVDDPGTRENLVNALKPGKKIHEALRTPIKSS